MIIAWNDQEALLHNKACIRKCFKMKDVDALKYFRGLEVAKSHQGLFMSQCKYASDIIFDSGLLGTKPANFPKEQHHQLVIVACPLFDDTEKYRRLMGRLIHLAVTRSDLAYSFHIMSQFMQSPKVVHWEAALLVVSYLNKNPG